MIVRIALFSTALATAALPALAVPLVGLNGSSVVGFDSTTPASSPTCVR